MADSGRKSHSLILNASAPHSLVAIAMLTSLLWLITFLPLYYQMAEFGVDTANMGNLEIVALPFMLAAMIMQSTSWQLKLFWCEIGAAAVTWSCLLVNV